MDNENKTNEFELEDLEVEFIEDKDLESVAGGIKGGTVYVDM